MAQADDETTTHSMGSGQPQHTLVRRVHLAVLSGPDAGRTYDSTRERVVIGTHASADLALSDRTVSRFHCELFMDEGQVRIRDLRSRNGTRIDGIPVLDAYLPPGATLLLGGTKIKFDPQSDMVKIPLSERSRFGILVGQSIPMRAIFATLERAAIKDVTVLIEGETGTGKEAAAESIHRESPRRDAPFVVVDCGAIPSDLLESELFGHERGAFTGAVSEREGAFEAAHGGTIFLDEIGELAPELQPKLLRALERRSIKRIGANAYHPIDVRIVAASNRDLQAAVNARQFRADLYYRLAVVKVRIPPLRERPDDLPLLVDEMLAHLGAQERAEAKLMRTFEFRAELARHSWPGNVRELRNYIESCLAL